MVVTKAETEKKVSRACKHIFVFLLILAGLSSGGCGSKEKDNPKVAKAKSLSAEQRVYQFEMVFINDAATFLKYKQKLRGLSVVHNGHLERTLVVDNMLSKDGVKPDLVNIVYYDSAQARTKVENDPEYIALSALRDSAYVSLSVIGKSIGGELIAGSTLGHAYMIEFVQYLNGDSTAYQDYSELASTLMGRYGYHLERVIKPTSSKGIAQPDLIRVMYFDSAEKLAEMQKDPDFAPMMKQYELSVDRSLWIIGKTPPADGSFDQLLGKG